MCMPPTHHLVGQPNVSPADENINNMSKNTSDPSFKPSIIQATLSIVSILSIVAYLVPFGDENEDSLGQQVAEGFSMRNSWFPYIFTLAFLFNASMNIVTTERIQNLLDRWRKRAPSAGIRSTSSSEALSHLARVSSAKTFRRISQSICSKLHSYNRRIALQAITRKEPFAKLNYIERLSVEDMAVLYRYVTEINQPDFNKNKFKSKLESKLVRAILTAMDTAVAISRGGHGGPETLTGTRRQGDVDALYFVAATRIFIEWRALRNVPKGYQRYAVAMNLAYRDVLQNLVKIEIGVHSYLRYQDQRQHQGMHKSSIPSPTLRQLLEYERDTGCHPNLPRLKEKSAASGLLWAKRQIHYHTIFLGNALEVPTRYGTLKDAATTAYQEVYKEYHGWSLQKVFTYNLGGSPPLDTLWKEMIPPASADLSATVQPSKGDGKAEFLKRKLTDVSEDSQRANEDDDRDDDLVIELERLGMHIAERWHDVLRYFRCVQADTVNESNNLLLIPTENYEDMKRKLDKASRRAINASLKELPSTSESLDEDDADVSVDDPIQKVRFGSANFVKELLPFLNDLGDLLDELNMNDPSKV